MKQKRRMELFAFYDHKGISAHLEKMAAKGWMLEEMGPYFWTYRRMEQKKLRFAVTYQPGISVFQRDFVEKRQQLRELCQLEGWQFVAEKDCMQVYCHAGEDPVPLETDAVLQVSVINEAAWKTHLRAYWLISGLAFFFLLFWILLVAGEAHVLRDLGWMTGLVVMVLFLLHGVVELAAYYAWYEKAEKLAREHGILHPTKSRRGFHVATAVFGILLVVSQQTDGLLRAVLQYGSFLLVPVVLGTVGGKLADRLGLPPTGRKLLTVVICVLWVLLARRFWIGRVW